MKTMMKTRSILTTTLTAALCWTASAFGAPTPEDMAKAEAGDAAAQEKVGSTFYGENNYAEAAAWYAKAGEQGRGNACYMLAQMYDYSLGIAEDKNTATTWYRKALDADTAQAAQGDAEAMARIALCYRYGNSVAKDDGKAQEWDSKAFVIFKQRAEGGDTNVYWRISQAYSTGNGVEKDLAEAAKWHKRDAENGRAFAMSRMGQIHIKGEGVPQDYAAAAEWLQKAVAKEESGAYYHLGTLYENGNGVPKDTDKAVSLYKAGAAKNDYYARNRLNELNIAWDDGVLEEMQGKDAETIYAKAKSIMPATANAIKLYRMAAEADHAKAQFELGQALDLGFGNTTKNEEEAAKWYRAAADQGMAEAQYQMGYFHYYGKGVDKDRKEATRWFLKAAEQEHKEAFFHVASAYEYGEGIPLDINEAIKWYRKSADAGNTVSAKKAQELQGAQNVAEGEDEPDDLTKLDASGKEDLERAEKGERRYQFDVGNYYAQGDHGFLKNMKKSLYWYKKAAAAGYSPTYGALVRLYRWEMKNEGKALYWAQIGAEYDNDHLKDTVAELEAKGVVVKPDEVEELEQGDDLTKLDSTGKDELSRAQKGDAIFQWTVAHYYENGEHGFPVNFKKATYWYKQSVSPDSPVSYGSLATLYKEAPPKFKNKGKQLYWLRLEAKHSKTPDEVLKKIAKLEAEGVKAIADLDDDD